MFSLRKLFLKKQAEREMDDELLFHLEKQIEQNIANGMSAEEARYAARRQFGNLGAIKEECREAWDTRFLHELAQDLRFGLRQLRRNPGFTVVAILTLALGIGANVAVFSLLDTVLLHQLPYAQPAQLFRLFRIEERTGRSMVSASYPDFQDWREQSHTFGAMAAYQEEDFNLSGTAEPERLPGLGVTPGLFALLGIHPRLGRGFSPNDGQHVVLLSYELWQSRFSGDAGITGRPVHLDGTPYTVLGVLPPHFHFPPRRWGGVPQVFVPIVPSSERGWHYVRVIGRLAPGTTEQQARAEMKGIAARLAQAYPKVDGGQGIAVDSLGEVAVSDVRQTALVLLGAVAFVLLIACANVANLLLSRGGTREREIAIRKVLGAPRPRIVRQLLTESLLLAGLGGGVGLVLAYWALPLEAFVIPDHTTFFTRVHDFGIHLNLTVFTFAAILSVLSVVLFGIFPAWRITRPIQGTAARAHTSRMRGTLIGLEVALSFVLLAGAGLMMRSLVRLLEVDVGFRTHDLLTVHINLSGQKYTSPEEQAAYFSQVLRRLGSLPSVLSAGATTDLPMTESITRNGFEIPGSHLRRGVASYHAVSHDYFRTMEIPLSSGRELMNSDTARSPLVGVVNQSMAHKYWPNQSPVGATLIVYRAVITSTPKGTSVQFKPQQLQIVGVVGDVRQVGLDNPPSPELFMPYSQWPSNDMWLVLHTRSESLPLIPIVKKEIWHVDSEQPITEVKTMNELVASAAAERRFVLELIGVFGLIAVLLAAVGIFGVTAYSVSQRTHDIGIRMALGAKKSDVLKMVVGQGLKLSLVGVAIGIGGALALTRFLASLLYGVKPTDPLTFFVVSLILIAVALVACYIPARRAAKVDPMVALRYE